MSLRPGRAGGRGVLSEPVLRTAVAVGAAAVVVDSINRWHAQRRARLAGGSTTKGVRRRSADRQGRPTRGEGDA